MVPPSFYAFGIFALGSLRYSLGSPLSSDGSGSSLAPLYIPDAPTHDLVNSSYIVILNDDVLPSDFSSHLSFIKYTSQVYPSPRANDNGGSALSHIYDSEIAKGLCGDVFCERGRLDTTASGGQICRTGKLHVPAGSPRARDLGRHHLFTFNIK